jgi:hypothetical protein
MLPVVGMTHTRPEMQALELAGIRKYRTVRQARRSDQAPEIVMHRTVSTPNFETSGSQCVETYREQKYAASTCINREHNLVLQWHTINTNPLKKFGKQTDDSNTACST